MPTSSASQCFPALTAIYPDGRKLTTIQCPPGRAAVLASQQSQLLLGVNDHTLVITAYGQGPSAYVEMDERRGGEAMLALNKTYMQCEPGRLDPWLPNKLKLFFNRGTAITPEAGKEMVSAAVQAYAAHHPEIMEQVRQAGALLPLGRAEHNAEVLKDVLTAPESLRLACPVPVATRDGQSR